MSKSNVETMGKTELRAACKAAGISYSKLTTEGMRNALKIRAAVKAVDGRSAPASKPAPVVTTPAAPAADPSPAVAVAPAAREMRNGVKRPGPGKCGDVWTALDQMLAGGIEPTTKDARDLATAKGWNVNNATAELSSWRRFNGLNKPAPTALAAKSEPKEAAAS